MDTINEETTAIVTIGFQDENEEGVIPDSASFILYDKFSGTVRRSGSLGALDTSVDLELTPDDNVILNQGNRYEIAVLYVEFTYSGRQGSSEYYYKILNLAKVT